DPPPPPGAEAPPELAALVLKTLSKKRDQRYQSCQELLGDLNVLKQRYPLEARSTADKQTGIEAAASVRDDIPAVAAMPAAAEEPAAAASATEETVDF